MDRRRACLAFLVLQSTAETLLTKRAAREGHSTASLVLVCELLKLLVYLCVLSWRAVRGSPSGGRRLGWRDACVTLVPAVLYVVQNTLLFHSFRLLDVGVQTVTYQLKILTTAFFSVWLLGRRLSRRQWLSLCLLAVGVAAVQLSSSSSSSSSLASKRWWSSDSALGLACVVTSSLTSGFAGVLTERLLKGDGASHWERSTILCVESLALSALSCALDASVRAHGVLHGFTAWSWLSAGAKALGGLAVSLVMRYADNILKGFATSCTIVLSSLLSCLLLGSRITAPFAAGASVVLYSVVLYGSEAPLRPKD